MLDLSTPQKECEEFYFPCNQILDANTWLMELYKHAPDKIGKFLEFQTKVLNAFRSYLLPVISLDKTTTKEAVCLVFEKVNTGGVPLSVFELVTASFATDSYNLRDDWYGSKLRNVEGREQRLKKEPILQTLAPTDYLQAIALLQTYDKRLADIAAGKTGKAVAAVSAKRVAILSLTLEDYRRWADEVEKGFLLAAKFLRKECFFAARDLPYRTQLVPIAAILAKLKERWLEPKIYEKLSQWFWCGVLGELYNGAVETRVGADLEEMLAWIDRDGEMPRTIYEATFNASRLHTLRSRLSAAYKGINILVLRDGSRDFFWKATVQELDFEEVALDIHHIFPRAWCEEQGIKPSIYNSIINKTPISYKANRMIGGKAPSKYLQSIQGLKQVGLADAQMDEILATHLIHPAMLRADDFQGFMDARAQKLLALIEQAMGKKAHQEAAQPEAELEEEYFAEEIAV